jgi:hypothetical protein
MDPCSIPALAITVAGIGLNAATSLAAFIESSHNAHSTWQRFHEEIKGLANVLQSLSHSLERADSQQRQQRPRRASEFSDENQHWRNVRTSISDCKRSLESFQTILEGIKVDESHLFAKPLQQFKLNQSADAMTEIRNQIVSYKGTLQMSLQMINM